MSYQERVSSEGFFSLYQGPTYIGKGWPWMYSRKFDSGEANIDFGMLVLTFIFWIVVGTILFLIIISLLHLVAKVKNRNIT